MEKEKIVTVIINQQEFKNVKYNIIKKEQQNIANMLENIRLSFTLEPEQKDYNNMDNLLSYTAQMASDIVVVASDETLTFKITNFIGNRKSFTVIANS